MNKGKDIFEDFYDIAETLISAAMEANYGATLIADGDFTAEVIKALFVCDDDDYLSIGCIDIDTCEFRDYDGPYLLTVDEDGEVWCEHALTKDGKSLLGFDSEYILVRPEYKHFIDNDWYTEADIYEVLLEDEEVEAETPAREGKIGLITNEKGEACGFTFHDNTDGRCVDVTYHSSESSDIDELLNKFNNTIEALLK